MKIIILEHEPFQERKLEHYFIEKFLKDGIEVEYWAINNILEYTKDVKYNFHENHLCLREFSSYNDFLKALELNAIRSNVFIVEVWLTIDTYDIYRILDKNRCNWIKIDYYLNPSMVIDTVLTKSSQVFHHLKNFPQAFKRVYNRIKLKSSRFEGKPDVLFYSGNEKKFLPPAKKYISINYFDLETEVDVSYELPKQPFAVFLDVMMVNHPDFYREKNQKKDISKVYFNELNKLFDKLEDIYKVSIIVASHPKANYNEDQFSGRPIIKNHTKLLVQNAEYVITHHSLSLCFALIEKKPLILINFKSIFRKSIALDRIKEGIIFLAKELDVMMLEEETLNRKNVIPLKVNEKKYNDFLNSYYLAENNKVSSNYQIIKKSILELVQNEN